MSAKEWAVPVVLGLVTAGALWVAVPQDDDPGEEAHGASSTGTGSQGMTFFVFPFAESLGRETVQTTFVVIAPHGRDAAERHFGVVGQQRPSAYELEWASDRLALFRANNTLEGQHDFGPGNQSSSSTGDGSAPALTTWSLPRAKGLTDWELDRMPRLGVDGHNGTRITVHVFDEMGLLAATNAPANETEEFVGRSTPQQLPSGVWYVGANATAPNGTRHIPSLARPLFQQLMPIMQGLPVGGVASVRSDAYASVYGTLYVTVRIDGLIHAP